jgi:alkylation response protein AidB-like acyl-CoA dehydrogenase
VLGGADQRRRFFDGVRTGHRLAAAFAERGGQHAQDLRTRLTRDDRGLTLSGQKYYCTGALTARWIGVSALDDADKLVVAFVENGACGLTLDQDWNVMGQRATVSGSARLDAVAVDPTLVVPYHLAFERPQQLGARAQLVHAAIQVGIAKGALRDAGEFVRTRARPFFEAVRAGRADSAATDPYTIGRFGRLATRVNAAEQLLLWAARTLETVGLVPTSEEDAAIGSLAVAQAKAFASETAVEVASDLFSLAGASAADERHDLSRHWRNARTHASHDPVDWKYHHIGSFSLSGTLPPSHGQL